MKDKENVDENKINSEVTKTKDCDIRVRGGEVSVRGYSR